MIFFYYYEVFCHHFSMTCKLQEKEGGVWPDSTWSWHSAVIESTTDTKGLAVANQPGILLRCSLVAHNPIVHSYRTLA